VVKIRTKTILVFMATIAMSCNDRPPPLFLAQEDDVIDPLQHLASTDDPDILPAQSPSLRDQILQITIELRPSAPTNLNRRSPFLLLSTPVLDAAASLGQRERCASIPILYTPYYRHRVCLLQVLARYIARRGKALQGLNVLELGSGTGLVGLTAGYFGARVYITDQAWASLCPRGLLSSSFANARPLIPIMERNIALNSLQSSVTAAELDWYDTSTHTTQPPSPYPQVKAATNAPPTA
jgi:hypothetical protein